MTDVKKIRKELEEIKKIEPKVKKYGWREQIEKCPKAKALQAKLMDIYKEQGNKCLDNSEYIYLKSQQMTAIYKCSKLKRVENAKNVKATR